MQTKSNGDKTFPKKSLGQNFLTSEKAVLEIISAGEIKPADLILEIGPGKGVLTEKILATGAKLIIVEKDKDLIPLLTEKLQVEIQNKQLTLIENDILDFDISAILKNQNYKLIANIPYYITGDILEKFLSSQNKPAKLVLLVQKEVAERIVAKNNKESILSLSVKLYGNPKIVYKVNRGSFYPVPKVDSRVIVIDTFQPKLSKKEEDLFFKIVKASFSHKRKLMLSNLKTTIPKIAWLEIFEKLEINKQVRAEDLKLIDFLNILREV